MNKDEFNALLKKADQGDADAQVNIGLKYVTGEGIEIDNALAFSYFKKAAAQENADGLFYLGMSYWYGNGIASDIVRAKELLQKASDKGHVKAAVQLRGLQTFLIKDMEEKAAESQAKIDDLMKEIKADAKAFEEKLTDILNDLEKEGHKNGSCDSKAGKNEKQ